jgi:lysozyme
MSEQKGKKHKKIGATKKSRFPVVIILIVLGIALAIGFYSYVFQRYVLSPYSRFRASHSEVRYPDGYSVRGIDISRYQGTIDWQKVKNDMIGGSSIQFVFIKATEGVTIFDPHFNDNFYKVREHGLLRGAYHFFTPSENGEKQAAHFLRQVHLEEGDLPPVIDVEEIGNLSVSQLRSEVLDWLRIVEHHYGVKPIIYSPNVFK